MFRSLATAFAAANNEPFPKPLVLYKLFQAAVIISFEGSDDSDQKGVDEVQCVSANKSEDEDTYILNVSTGFFFQSFLS